MCASAAMRMSSLRLEPYVGKGDGASEPLKAREIELLRTPGTVLRRGARGD